MNELEKLREWVNEHSERVYFDGKVLDFNMFRNNWEAWEVDCGIALGKIGVFLTVRNSWQAIAQYLIKYSISSECQLKRIADALWA